VGARSPCDRHKPANVLRVSVKKVNILSVELDEPLDEAGFRHVATSVGLRLGAQRIGASVYQAEAGLPIWPYHYHHGIEEWLYVIAGAPVLREPAGERILTPGDLVCFPSGHLGAHTLKGPGRLVIFATGHDVEPYMSVYPDSDKVSGPEGILLRKSAVSYWHGEGTAGPSESVEIVREPKRSPPQPAVNALPSVRRRQTRTRRRDSGIARRSSARYWAPTGSTGRWWTWIPVRDLSPTTTSMGGRSGCWSWPERRPCATRKVRLSSRTAILCASRKAQPVLTGCSIAASRSCARCSYRRRVCRPMFATRTPGTG
jgi:uncharacterized cupin superfamily protein